METTMETTITTTQPEETPSSVLPVREASSSSSEGGGGRENSINNGDDDEEEALLRSVMLNSGVMITEGTASGVVGNAGSVEQRQQQQRLTSSQQEQQQQQGTLQEESEGAIGRQQSFGTSVSVVEPQVLPKIRWSTSICGLFQSSNGRRKSDFCAITCCGVLLKDRNQYLLNVLEEELDEHGGSFVNIDSMLERIMRNDNNRDRHRRARTTNWKSRCFFIFMIPLCIMMITNHLLLNVSSSSPSSNNNEEDNNSSDADNNSSNHSYTSGIIIVMMRLFLLGYVMYWLYQSKIHRINLRQAIISKMMLLRPSSYRENNDEEGGGNNNGNSDATRVLQLQLASRNSREFRNSTSMCCSSFEKEHDYYYIHVGTAGADADAGGGDGDGDGDGDDDDMATCLWNSLAKSCCGFCCGCWCQLCGMCSIGQEDRELETILKQQQSETNNNNNWQRLFHIDYITFQPWIEYYPKILEVRNRSRLFNTGGDWADHLGAISELSQHILKWFAAGVLVLLIMSIVVTTSSIASFCINIIGTTMKTGIVLYIVYWKTNRYDISLDAIIKYVAAGFVLSTFMAVIVEQLLMIVLSPIAILMVVFDVLTVDTGDTPLDQWLMDPKNLEELMKSHLGQAAIFAFVFSFVVAAFVEELMKYMTYWMTETPDLLTLGELGLASSQQQQQQGSTSLEDSKVRRSRAVTIAMVAVATGFAWSENISYIRSVSSKPATGGLPGTTTTTNVWANELTLLIFRSIMPVHELCAALQSIGIVKRDILNDRDWKLGRSLLPAIILHGTYDFVAIFGSILQKVLSGDDGNDDEGGDNDNNAGGDDDDESLNPMQMLQMFLMVAPIVLMGAWYYYRQAKIQRQLLESTDGYDEVATTTTGTSLRGTASSMQVILEEEEDSMVEGSGDDLDAPLLEASSSSGVAAN